MERRNLKPRRLLSEGEGENDPNAPALTKVKPQMGRKTRIAQRSFFTFITPEAKKTLLRYREWRKRKGET
jgi:hypothetical protein